MKDPLMSYEKISEWLPCIEDFWTRTFIATQYFCAARVGELVKKTHRTKKYAAYYTNGLIYERVKEYDDYWMVDIPNFKQKKPAARKKAFFVKSVEPWLNEILAPLFREKQKGRVFPFGFEKARKMVKLEVAKLGRDSNTGRTFTSHNLRDTRADHLRKVYNFDARDLQRTLGLSSISILQHYIESTLDDRIQRMKKEGEQKQ